MNFLTFFLYYMTSSLILEGVLLVALLLRRQYRQHVLKQDIANGKVQMVSIEELLEELSPDKDKKTWN